ncbi:MAG: hypothetical protein PF542_01565 [Nanoarchaeota archaeon]|jgi:hypothetical protein|nr:hypothetical protein [Nanoarchaeota archaeon]
MIKDIGVKSLEEQLWVKGYELEDDLRTRGASPAFRQGALALLRQIELMLRDQMSLIGVLCQI